MKLKKAIKLATQWPTDQYYIKKSNSPLAIKLSVGSPLFPLGVNIMSPDFKYKRHVSLVFGMMIDNQFKEEALSVINYCTLMGDCFELYVETTQNHMLCKTEKLTTLVRVEE